MSEESLIEQPSIEAVHFEAVTLKDVARNPYIDTYLRRADEYLAALGYTEHGLRHAALTAKIARNILLRLDRDPRDAELAAIGGYLHDIGNIVNRNWHAQSSAAVINAVMINMNADPDDLATVLGAVGNHDEKDGHPVSAAAAAVIIADKTDVHRSRVRNPHTASFDIHDRVNYSVVRSYLRVLEEERTITLELEIDNDVASTMDYFEIFMSRMLICRRAADFLGCQFKLVINQVTLL